MAEDPTAAGDRASASGPPPRGQSSEAQLHPDREAQAPAPGDHDLHDHDLRERLHRLEEAAVVAEFETGKREETVQEAQRHVVLRVVRISAGVAVTAIGVALLALPGPGLVVVALGLGLLAQDVPFARRVLDNVQDRIPRDADGNLPTAAKVTLVLSLTGAIAATGVSLWWTFLR